MEQVYSPNLVFSDTRIHVSIVYFRIRVFTGQTRDAVIYIRESSI